MCINHYTILLLSIIIHHYESPLISMLWMLAKSCTTTTKRMLESQQWEYHLPQLVIFISQPSIDIHRVPICSHHFEEFPRFSYDFPTMFKGFSSCFLYFPVFSYMFPIFSHISLYFPIFSL